MSKDSIAFIGLGAMGLPMARNLVKAGHELFVFDLSAAAVQLLVAEGATAVESPAAAAEYSPEIIITMLPAAQHVKSVYLGDNGLLAALKSPTLLIDSSTIDTQSARDVASAVSATLMVSAVPSEVVTASAEQMPRICSVIGLPSRIGAVTVRRLLCHMVRPSRRGDWRGTGRSRPCPARSGRGW